MRFEDEVGLRLERATDLILLSYPLPQTAEFTGAESSYREAVEYLVQIGLRDIRGKVRPPLILISNIRTTPLSSSKNLAELASAIVSSFQETYISI